MCMTVVKSRINGQLTNVYNFEHLQFIYNHLFLVHLCHLYLYHCGHCCLCYHHYFVDAAVYIGYGGRNDPDRIAEYSGPDDCNKAVVADQSCNTWIACTVAVDDGDRDDSRT